jgi:hypothetical protein
VGVGTEAANRPQLVPADRDGTGVKTFVSICAIPYDYSSAIWLLRLSAATDDRSPDDESEDRVVCPDPQSSTLARLS